jgi:ketosteroid isomerase-like protein
MKTSLRVLALASCLPAAVSAQTALRIQVDSIHAAMVMAFRASPASTAAFYTGDAAIVGGGTRVIGGDAVSRYWRDGMDGATWQLEVLDVGGAADRPWVHGKSTLQRNGRSSVTEYIGLLARGADQQVRFQVDAYVGWRDTVVSAAADVAGVRRLDSLWAQMYATHDTTSALQLYADPLVVLSANGRTKTRAEEMADIRPAAGLTMDYFRSAPSEVRTFNRIAVVIGFAEWKFTMNGTPREIRRPYTAVYARGGPLGWRIVALRMG